MVLARYTVPPSPWPRSSKPMAKVSARPAGTSPEIVMGVTASTKDRKLCTGEARPGAGSLWGQRRTKTDHSHCLARHPMDRVESSTRRSTIHRARHARPPSTGDLHNQRTGMRSKPANCVQVLPPRCEMNGRTSLVPPQTRPAWCGLTAIHLMIPPASPAYCSFYPDRPSAEQELSPSACVRPHCSSMGLRRGSSGLSSEKQSAVRWLLKHNELPRVQRLSTLLPTGSPGHGQRIGTGGRPENLPCYPSRRPAQLGLNPGFQQILQVRTICF